MDIDSMAAYNSNRAGSVKNSSRDAYKLVFEGGEEAYPCLDLGVAMLARANGILSSIDSWQWLDFDDPGENCDVLEAYAEQRLQVAAGVSVCVSKADKFSKDDEYPFVIGGR